MVARAPQLMNRDTSTNTRTRMRFASSFTSSPYHNISLTFSRVRLLRASWLVVIVAVNKRQMSDFIGGARLSSSIRQESFVNHLRTRTRTWEGSISTQGIAGDLWLIPWHSIPLGRTQRMLTWKSSSSSLAVREWIIESCLCLCYACRCHMRNALD